MTDPFAILVKRGGNWFSILDEDDCIKEFESLRQATYFAASNPLCQSSEALIYVNLNNLNGNEAHRTRP